jgi:transcriptional repressor NrdR
MVMEGLREMNEVAYVRFASVYRHFKDITGFEQELSRMREGKREISEPKEKIQAKK